MARVSHLPHHQGRNRLLPEPLSRKPRLFLLEKMRKKVLTYCKQYDIISTSKGKGVEPMGEIEKALQDLEKAVKSSDTVAKVTVTTKARQGKAQA